MDRSQKTRNDRLVKLLPKIEARAHRLIRRYEAGDVIEDSDVVNEACCAFLQRAAAEVDFLTQSDDKLIHRCVLDGWNAARRQQQKGWQIPWEDTCWTTDNGDVVETIAADAPGPEELTIAGDLAERVHRSVAELKPVYRLIARELMAGRPKGEIMASIGTSPQAFTFYRHQLAVALQGVDLWAS